MDCEFIFRKSFGRVISLDPFGNVFFKRFYQRLFVSPEVREKFRNVDMSKQYIALERSLLLLVEFFVDKKPGKALEKIAVRHTKSGLDIPPRMYDLWLEAMLETVREMDPDQNDEVLRAWKTVLSGGIKYMTDVYEQSN